MNKLSLRALEYLNAIAHLGSLRKAAVKLNVDPSAISRRLALLEEEIGLQLWIRNRQRSQITLAGQELFDYYRQIQASEAAVLSRIYDLKGLRKGEIKIAVAEEFITNFISTPLQDFMNKYHRIQISIDSTGANEVIHLIEDDQIDFAIVYGCSEKLWKNQLGT